MQVNGVAILCAGLDDVQRGYERHTRLLFSQLAAESGQHVPVTLFKRVGQVTPTEVTLRVPSRQGWWCVTLARVRASPMYWESICFALRFVLWVALRRRRFQAVAAIEPMVARCVSAFRWALPGTPRLIYTHGVWNEPAAYARVADVVHEVNVENYARAKAYFQEHAIETRLVLLPHFMPEETAPAPDCVTLRERYGIRTPYVALTVGAINRHHKRMHYAISEAASLPSTWTLLMCGHPEGEEGLDLLKEGRRLLGDRFVHVALPADRVREAYAMADLFFLASTQEGFGLVILEAMRAGLPVIVHDRELFRWITRQPDCCIPLDNPGALARFITATVTPAWIQEKKRVSRAVFESRYTWQAVRGGYYDLLFGQRPDDSAGSNPH